ncbi:PA14 domain-containing protein [Hymenobacter wooponensis]|uniref:OmpA family protein n=1 Tax=Hymenobacter wooponensis TaxID=1525360 RepID=A0A4Z0MRI6_9BACT|nr:PA14 domain-containing protein [Hymenobacter wooponensis]TGD81837.1 hypothetical protein EU557_09910 [Hymenobacter wooponensis]
MASLSFYRAGVTAMLLLTSGLAMAQHQAGTGLRGQYYAGKKFEKLVLTRTDPTIDFNWTIGPNGDHFVSPGPGVPGEWFSVRWAGHIYAPVTGTYTFQIATDDGMRIWIGGDKVLDSWKDQPATISTTHLKMKAGSYYSLRVEYYQFDRDSRAQLAWQLPDSSEEPQPIPTENLYRTLPDNVLVLAEATPPKPKATAAIVPTVAPTVTPAPTPVKAVAKPTTAASPIARRARPVVSAKPAPARPPAADTTTVELPDLTALSKGAAVTLPNLYFTQSTATLLPSSRPTLNALVRTLRAQPAMRLEVAGHTDNVGEAALNLRLSEQRARVVRQYLVQQGIDSVRLTARGYGGARPVADNRDPQQRPRNRRVEVVVQ